jgi:hypothetical protein
MAPAGLALGGPVANALGIPAVFVITGIGCMGIAVVWALSPTILNMEEQREEHKGQLDAAVVAD